MAYQTPIITPSGTTFAQFQAGGFKGQLIRIANANNFPPAIRSLVLGRLEDIKTGIVHSLDAFLQGDPVATADVNAKLLAYETALKAIAAALDEVNVLVDANPGTLATFVSNISNRKRRTFP